MMIVLPRGGDTRVLTIRNRTNIPTMAPNLLIKSISVIFTALADRTRNITEILKLGLFDTSIIFHNWILM